MRSIVTLAMVTVFSLAAVESASAKSGGNNHASSHHNKSDGPPKYMGGTPSGKAPVGTPENPFKHHGSSKHKGHGKDEQPPGMIVDPVRVTSGGFVWANDHWERAKATPGVSNGPTMIVDPTLGPVVRDHRTLTSTTTPPFGNGGHHYQPYQDPNVRDHRGGASQGGVSVTNTPGSTRNNDVIGVGASPVDSVINGVGSAVESGVGTVVNGIGNLFGYDGQLHSPPGRDHRTTDTSNFGSNVRDHR